MNIRSALVVGGGIGGLAAAAALARSGVSVELIEKQPSFDIPGVGLGQPAGALRIYESLGIVEEILDIGYAYGHMNVRDPALALMATHRFRMGDDRIPAFCALPRADLHRILLARVRALGVTVRLGIETMPHDGLIDGEVRFSDGTERHYDLVAGFDGIRSSIRQAIFGDLFGPRHSGFGAWRIQVDRHPDVTGMEFVQGLGGKAGVIPISNERMYLFNIRPEPDVRFDTSRMHVLLAERLHQFGGYVGEIASALTAESRIVYGALEPFILPHPWHRGRVVLGGDAAHVVPPHLTAGAAMALEDGVALAAYMTSTEGTPETRLDAYGRARFARNAFVYCFARDWLEREQSVATADDLEAARKDYARNLSARIAFADQALDHPQL